jgi:phosphoribosylanthranilate isomerase
MGLRVKICGITQPEQGAAIVRLGASALGFICVAKTPRYVSPEQIRAVVDYLSQAGEIELLPEQWVDRVGVFVDASVREIERVATIAYLNSVQLHGTESPEFCQQLRATLPTIEIIKALRIRTPEALSQAHLYQNWVDTLLLDAYHPNLLGGTGATLDWSTLARFRPECPWLLAGGLTPENVLEAIHLARPNGVDLSSGVENAPGDKNLERVAQLFSQLQKII